MCDRCYGQGWVCENHPDKAWEHEYGCSCGAGMPCPDCNNGPVPRPLPDYTTVVSNLRFRVVSKPGHVKQIEVGQVLTIPQFAQLMEVTASEVVGRSGRAAQVTIDDCVFDIVR